MSDVLERLQTWYSQQCNGEWEHVWGIKIETLDNPGWSFEINLAGTVLESRRFEKLTQERSERDWIVCWTENSKFNGVGGPQNLIEILETFLRWASRSE